LIVCPSPRLARYIKEYMRGRMTPYLSMDTPVMALADWIEALYKDAFNRGLARAAMTTDAQAWTCFDVTAPRGDGASGGIAPSIIEAIRGHRNVVEWGLLEGVVDGARFEEFVSFKAWLARARRKAARSDLLLRHDVLQWLQA